MMDLIVGIMAGVIVVTGLVAIFRKKDEDEAYVSGYNDCLLDIDDIIDEWKSQGIKTVGVETIRNRIALEHKEVEND